MALSVLILVVGCAIIVMGSLYESRITDLVSGVPVLKQASQYVAAITLTLVNYIVPKSLGWITDCERYVELRPHA